jgi:regulator of extracellular matrix RemA (YlzA/DUF370 family)
VIDRLLNIGYGHAIVAQRVVIILSPGSVKMKKLRDEAKKNFLLIDATQGKKTRSIIVTDSNHVVLSAFAVETIKQRYKSAFSSDEDSTESESKEQS